MPPIGDTLPAVVQTLAPHSDPQSPPGSSTRGRSRAKSLSLPDILNAEPVRKNSHPARVLSPRRKASPCNLAQDRSGEASHDDISQPQPRSRDTEIDQSRGREIWSNHEIQILKHVMSIGKHGDSHVYHRASAKLDNVRSPSACWRKWGELTAAKKSNEKKAGKIPMNNAAWPAKHYDAAKQYDGEPALEQYHDFLASGWNVVDADKIHVLKHVDTRCPRGDRLVSILGHKHSAEPIRKQWEILRRNGFSEQKPPSRSWTDADIDQIRSQREGVVYEIDLAISCSRTREDIPKVLKDLGLEHTVLSRVGHRKRKAVDRKEGDDESKRRRRG